MATAIITNIQKFSVHDGPGVRSTVFLKGCPMSCQWCSNPENQDREYRVLYSKAKCTHCGLCIKDCKSGVVSAINGYTKYWNRVTGVQTGTLENSRHMRSLKKR